MAGRINNKKLNASILEIVCTLGIFVIVSVFVLKLFLGANSLEMKARDISKASIIAESMGETIKGYDSMEQAIKELKLIQIQDNYSTAIYEKYYNSDWKPVKKPSAYRAILTVEQNDYGEDEMYVTQIILKSENDYPVIKDDDSKELISLQVCSYKEKAQQ